ncbi:MAG: type II toxin-antitoxin system RelB/DinJ family antitoxin, partial [Clostridiales Family XIII bacterium]|nr:type II toxin-antitoxin system RelB/DinJ family antitoxin [Clostridiales Family XIII bacterium]
MAQINVNIRMDENLKHDFEAVCGEMGLTMTTAFTVFAKIVSQEKEIPFKISAKRGDVLESGDFGEEMGHFPGERLSVEETAGIAKEWAVPHLLDTNTSIAWEQAAACKEQQRQENAENAGKH